MDRKSYQLATVVVRAVRHDQDTEYSYNPIKGYAARTVPPADIWLSASCGATTDTDVADVAADTRNSGRWWRRSY